LNKTLSNSIDHGINRGFASKFGIPAAFILNRLIYSINIEIEYNNENNFINGRWWSRDTAQSLAVHFQGLFTLRVIRTILKKLQDESVILIHKPFVDDFNTTNIYTVNCEILYKFYTNRQSNFDLNPIGTRYTRASISGNTRPSISRGTGPVFPTTVKSLGSISKNINIQKDPDTDGFPYESKNPNTDTSSGEQKPLTKQSEKESKVKTYYRPGNEFREVYENFFRFKGGRKNFKENDYDEYLLKMMDDYNKTVPQLIELSDKWAEHHSEQTKKPISYKSSFRTWLNNDMEWNKNNKKTKVDLSGNFSGTYDEKLNF